MSRDLPPIIGGRYRPIGLLGQGGMGAVYEAEHERTGERVALKVLHRQIGLDPKIVDRFMREARASALVKSDHVVRVMDADVAPELDGSPYLVMELLEGADLERLAGDTPQPPARVVEWMRQVARALDKAHAAGIVHRDLKPENLFVASREDGTPVVKILDFGIAKMAADAGLSTQSGQILGTPRYMAPEQARGDGNGIGPATDLFSVGLIVFRLLVGRTYFRGETVMQLMGELLVEPMAPASQRGSRFGAPFDAWFARACDRDPARRFATADEMIEALAAALGEAARSASGPHARIGSSTVDSAASTLEAAQTLAAAATEIATTGAPNRRARNVIVLGASAAALVIGGIVWSSLHDSKSPSASAQTVSTAPPPAPEPSASVAPLVVPAALAPSAPAATIEPAVAESASAAAVTRRSAPRTDHATAPAKKVGPAATTTAAAAPTPKPAAPEDPLDEQK